MLELNKIYQIDCMQGLKKIESDSIGLVITSPPYFVGKEYETDCSDFNDYLDGLLSVFMECYRVLKPSRYLIINIDDAHVNSKHPEWNGKSASNLGTHAHLIVNLSKLFTYKDLIVWNKIRNFSGLIFVNHPHYPISAFGEYVLIFKKEGIVVEDKLTRERHRLSKEEYKEFTQGIWNFSGKTKNRNHPAEFPEELPRRIIKMFSFEKDIIIDPFIGSGTTAVVAKKLGRDFIGFEINKKYVDVAERRLSQRLLSEVENAKKQT